MLLRETALSLVGSMLSPLRAWCGGHPSPAAQLGIDISFPLVLSSGPPWPILSLLALNEGELRSHQLFCRVGQAHLPTLVLLMVGAQWILHDWNEGPVVPLLSFVSILSYMVSFLASVFSIISFEASDMVRMMKLKSSSMSIVCNLVLLALDFFLEVGFVGETFLFLYGSASSTGSLGSVTLPCFC
jgi:hypothetical protein